VHGVGLQRDDPVAQIDLVDPAQRSPLVGGLEAPPLDERAGGHELARARLVPAQAPRPSRQRGDAGQIGQRRDLDGITLAGDGDVALIG